MDRRWLISVMLVACVNSALAAPLSSVIIQALETGPDMQVVIEERLIKEEQVREAYGKYLPKATLTSRMGVRRVASPLTQSLYNDTDRTLHERSHEIKVSQMLFDGYKAQADIEHSIWETKAHAALVKHQAQEVALAVAKVYLDVLKHTELSLVAEDELSRYERLANETRYKARNHLVRQSAVDLVIAQLASARQRASETKSELERATYHFKRLAGTLPDVEGMQIPEVSEKHFPATQSRAVAKAFLEHPAFKVAMHQLQASKAQLKAADAELLPEVSLEVDFRDAKNLNGLSGQDNTLGANLVVSYNLYEGGQKHAQKRQAQRSLYKETQLRNIVRRDVELEVKEAWDRYKILDEQAQTQAEHLSALKGSRDAQWADFTQGNIPIYAWLESDEALSSAEYKSIAFKYDSLFEKFNLLSSMGVLLSSLDIPLPEAAEFNERHIKPWDFDFAHIELF